MTLPTIFTYTGAVLSINSVAMQDHTAEMTFTLNRDISEYVTWGGQSAAPGPLKGSGSIRVPVIETAASPYRTLLAELLTPTSGGIAVIFQPKGAGVGTNQEWTFNIVIGGGEHGGEGGDVQEGTFPFTITGAISYATQT